MPDDNREETTPPSAMFRPGEIIDRRFRVVRELGRGGYGTVYLAEELDADGVLAGPHADEPPLVLREVAVKVLDSREHDPRRFAGEVQALCRLSHPSIVTVHAFGRTECPGRSGSAGSDATWIEFEEGATLPYLAMEFIDGPPLSALGQCTPGDVQRVIGLLIQLADALGHAHARGVVHRDLKPHNILLGPDGVPRVVDFGLAWMLRNEDPASQHVGTPGFLAPELLAPGDALRDHRADIYGLGATAFALFTGESPFKQRGLFATVKAQLAGTFDFPDTFPGALRGIVSRCLSRDPLDRPRAAALVAEELRRVAHATGVVVGDGRTAVGLDAFDELPGRVDLRDARVVSVDRFEHATRGAGLRFELAQGVGEGGAEVRGFCYAERERSAARRTHDVLSWAWEGAELSLYGARALTDSSGRRFLAADGSTVPVLDPYFPVSVTDVAKADGVRCGACATRVLVDLREPTNSGPPLVIGSLAHDMLERMVRSGGSVAFDTAFDESLAALRMDALAAGIVDEDLSNIRGELAEHFTNIARWSAATETGRSQRAEVRRFSARYGIEGRIDLSVFDDEVTRIVELKTGRYESPEHERQLRCYTLMWDAIAQTAGRRIEGQLLYSRTGKLKPLVRRSHEVEREVVVARNDLVAMHRWFSDGDTRYRPPSHMDDPALCADSPCRFRRDRCAAQTRLLGSIAGDREVAPDAEAWRGVAPELADAARAYYFHFLRLIEREYRAASHAMGDVFRAATVADRVERLRAVEGARIASSDPDSRTVVFACDAWGVFDEGDSVLAHRGDFDAEPSLAGKVVERTASSLTIRCEGAETAASLPPDGWVLDQDVLRIGFRAMHKALFALIEQRDVARLALLATPTASIAHDVSETAAEHEPSLSLNGAQRRALGAALASPPALLVQGPPGTGKTAVIAEMVAAMVARGERVLLAACTHTAVDTALARVVRAGVSDVLRVGWPRAGGELVQALDGQGLRAALHHTATLAQASGSLAELDARVSRARVVAATTNACASDATFSVIARGVREGEHPFDVAIVDEASQLTEPLTLAAINLAKRFVLVGDERQLPPVVVAPDALSAVVESPGGPLRGAGFAGLDRSMFERLRPFAPHVLLTTQYRMNAELQSLPSAAFYGDALSADGGVTGRRLALDADRLASLDEDLRDRLDPAQPGVWIATESAGHARVNEGEVREIVRTLEALAATWPGGTLDPSEVGVVTPFRAQGHALRVAIREALGDVPIEVDTVERFQGREKEVMIVSLVVGQWSDFVMNANRLNVALTRARSKLIVFGAAPVRRRLVEVLGEAVEAIALR